MQLAESSLAKWCGPLPCPHSVHAFEVGAVERI